MCSTKFTTRAPSPVDLLIGYMFHVQQSDRGMQGKGEERERGQERNGHFSDFSFSYYPFPSLLSSICRGECVKMENGKVVS